MTDARRFAPAAVRRNRNVQRAAIRANIQAEEVASAAGFRRNLAAARSARALLLLGLRDAIRNARRA